MKEILQMVLAVGMTGVVLAQSNAPVRDMGAGFAALRKLGLPDVTGGTYGKLEITQYPNAMANHGGMYGGNLESMGLSGNAWKIKELGEGSNRYVVGAVRVTDVMEQKTFEAWQKRQQEEMVKASATQQLARSMNWGSPPLVVGRWKAADIKKDVEKLLKMAEGTDENNNRFQYDLQAGAEVLLAAAHYYRLGMTNEANRIADRIFTAQRNPRQLIPAAIGIIAQEQYSKAFAAFRQSRDWAAWHKDMTDILGNFRDWPQAKGVVKLAGLVKARVDLPDPPALAGEGLNDDDQKLARRMVVEPPSAQVGYYGNEFWLLPQPNYNRSYPGQDTNDVMMAIRRRGMGSIPMLVAMLRDNTLTPRDRNQGGYYYPGMSSGHGQSEEKVVEAMFNSIQRPSTRGEIARGMLQPLLIMDDRQRGSMHNMSSDDMAVECEAWYKEYKGKTTEELARIYMDKGDQSQRQYAMNYLMQGKNQEANRAEIEKMLLTMAKESTDTPYIIQQYVQQRREKASNFVEQVAVVMAVTNAPAPAGKDVVVPRRMRPARGNDREAFVKQLREMVAVRSVRELLNEFVSGTQPVARAQMKLHEQIGREAPEESLVLLLEASQKVEDPIKRGMLIGMVAILKHARLGGVDQMDPDAMDPVTGTWKANKFDPAKHAALWNKLLEDKSGEGRTIRETAAFMIETLYAEDKPQQPGMPYYGRGDAGLAVLTKLGERGQELIVERARARLAGKPVPELPSAEKVDAAQRQKMVESILSAKDAGEALAKLTLDEQLALGDVCKSNKAVNVKLRPIADGIVEVKIAPEFKTAAALEGRLKGRKFDKETVRLLMDAALQLTREGQSVNATIGRRPSSGGTVVTFSKPPVVDQNNEMAAYYGMMGMAGMGTKTNRQVVAGVKAWLVGGKHSANAWWPAKAPAAIAVAGTDLSAGIGARLLDEAEAELRSIAVRQEKSEQDDFWEQLTEVIEKSGAFLPVSVTFYGEAEKAAVEVVKK